MRAAAPYGTLGYRNRFIGIVMGIGGSVTLKAGMPGHIGL